MKIKNLNGKGPYKIENGAIIIGSSLVYGEETYNLSPFDENIEYLPDEIAKFLRRRVKLENEESCDYDLIQNVNIIGQVDAPIYSFNSMHPDNYFHLLIEHLPTLAFLMKSKYLPDDTIIVTGVLHENFVDALKLVTCNKFPILQLKQYNCIKSSVVYCDHGSFSGNELISGNMPSSHIFNHKNILLLKKLLFQYYELEGVNRPKLLGRKIFILRQSFQRNIKNIEELIEIAKEHNFEIVRPEKLSFEEQAKLFSTSSFIVGPTGAWLANLIFTNKSAKVHILFPDYQPTNFWTVFSSIFDIEVSNHYFPVTTLNQYQPIHSDFVVTSKKFRSILSTQQR
jgi:capsular polysaccharide biosynthesis protein